MFVENEIDFNQWCFYFFAIYCRFCTRGNKVEMIAINLRMGVVRVVGSEVAVDSNVFWIRSKRIFLRSSLKTTISQCKSSPFFVRSAVLTMWTTILAFHLVLYAVIITATRWEPGDQRKIPRKWKQHANVYDVGSRQAIQDVPYWNVDPEQEPEYQPGYQLTSNPSEDLANEIGHRRKNRFYYEC